MELLASLRKSSLRAVEVGVQGPIVHNPPCTPTLPASPLSSPLAMVFVLANVLGGGGLCKGIKALGGTVEIHLGTHIYYPLWAIRP